MIHVIPWLPALVSLGLISAVSAPMPVPPPIDPDPAYTLVIQKRAQKIVDTLGMEDDGKALQVRDHIADQYRNLSTLHDTRDAQIKAVIRQAEGREKAADLAVKAIQDVTKSLQEKRHTQYLLKLGALLTPAQVDQVKDGMTYGVVPLTYGSYLEMLPQLNEEEKATLMAYLIEAREIAMDGGSSKEKHGWFGKYKGRINNYLSARGYDLKQASKERNARINASKR